MVMYFLSTLLLLTTVTDQILARVHVSTCPRVCECTGRSAKCVVTDHTVSAVLRLLPRSLTKLDLSRGGLIHLNINGAFRKFDKLVFLSLADNSLKRLRKGSLQGLQLLTELHLQGNGKDFRIEHGAFRDTPSLTKIRLEGNSQITSLKFLRLLGQLREVLVDSENGCELCKYTAISRKVRCHSPGYCVAPRKSPFADTNCACVFCAPMKSKMASGNCSGELYPGFIFLGDSTAVRVVLWLTSSLAFVSNLVLIISRCYTSALRQKPLGIFIAGIALSNLFVTSSVVILLIADSNQSARKSDVVDQGDWSDSICGPVYFLKHFGIHSLVFVFSLVVMDRLIKLGYHRCFTSQLTRRRSLIYVSEAWVLTFLLIIMPWTRVTTWHRACTASHETMFAQVMDFISGCLVIILCFFALLQVAVLFWRHSLAKKASMRTRIRTDLGLVLAAVLTFSLLAVPHGVVVIISFAGTEPPGTGSEMLTILLAILCAVYPLLFARYCPAESCVRVSSTSPDRTCTCGNCEVEHVHPAKYSVDPIHPPKSTVTLSSYQGGYSTQNCLATVTSTGSVGRMSVDSVIDLDTWQSQSTKTKSWVEACDYEDLKKLETQKRSQVRRMDSGFHEVGSKPRGSTWNNGNVRNSTSTSGVNDVYNDGSASTASEPMSSFHEGIYDHEILRSAPDETLPTRRHDDSDCGRTSSDSSKRSTRMSSMKELLQRVLSPRHQRSKSLPENGEIRVDKVERSQSMPFSANTLTRNARAPVSGNAETCSDQISIGVSSTSPVLSTENTREVTEENGSKERRAPFFILAPAKPPKCSRKNALFSRHSRAGDVSSASNARKSSIADRIAKSFSQRGRKSPLPEDSSSPTKTITLEEGDVLTELPVMRRTKLRTKPRDSAARLSTGSTGSTGSAATRFSLEWDPIGSMEGYAEREVLPPYPPVSRDNRGAPPRFPKPASAAQTSECVLKEILPERNSSYSLDWDPTSVQLRNSLISRDSVSAVDPSDDEGSTYDVGYHRDARGTTVWV